MEGVNTDTTPLQRRPRAVHLFRWFYHDLYTNKQNLMGSWIGRQAQGVHAWSKYSFNARNSLQFCVPPRQGQLRFYSEAERLTMRACRQIFWPGVKFGLSTRVQYEHWNYPILLRRPQTTFRFRADDVLAEFPVK